MTLPLGTSLCLLKIQVRREVDGAQKLELFGEAELVDGLSKHTGIKKGSQNQSLKRMKEKKTKNPCLEMKADHKG